MPTDAEVDARLREVSRLWSLAQQMPHVVTREELALLDECASFANGRHPTCSLQAATLGAWVLWRKQQVQQILRLADKVPAMFLRDMEFATFVDLARRSLATSGR